MTGAPPGYVCPFCELLAGRESEHNTLDDVVYRDEHTVAFVSPKWWEVSPAHVIVIPKRHFENLYETPDEELGRVYATAKRVAVALKDVYGCEGTSTRQHNEAGSGQDVWHLHVHVYARNANDRLYEHDARTRWATPEERRPYAERLRAFLSSP